METNRINAINWWNNLSQERRNSYFLEYSGSKFTPATKESELTGREIQIIWEGTPLHKTNTKMPDYSGINKQAMDSIIKKLQEVMVSLPINDHQIRMRVLDAIEYIKNGSCATANISKYLHHLPTCNIMQDWSEAETAFADTPSNLRDYEWEQARNDLDNKKSICTCGLEEAMHTPNTKTAEELKAKCESYAKDYNSMVAEVQRLSRSNGELLSALKIAEKFMTDETTSDYHEAVSMTSQEASQLVTEAINKASQ